MQNDINKKWWWHTNGFLIILGYYEIPILKSTLINTDFQTLHLIAWHHSCQQIRNLVRKSLLTNMEFNMDFT